MRLATFNILHGRTVGDGVIDADRLHSAVKALDPDVLALQEVDRHQARSGSTDQTAVAADAMGAVWARFVPAINGTPGRAYTPADPARPSAGPAYGIAMLSRLPVSDWREFRLPALPLRSPIRTTDGRWILTKDEPRVAASVVVEGSTGPLTVTTTHLSFVPGWNAIQLRRLLAQLTGMPEPQVLLGDLNMPNELPRSLATWRRLIDAPTYPANHPTLQLDHVLARGLVGHAYEAEVVELALSDHRAVVVDLLASA